MSITRNDLDRIFNTADVIVKSGRNIGDSITNNFGGNKDSRRSIGNPCVNNGGYNGSNYPYPAFTDYEYGYADKGTPQYYQNNQFNGTANLMNSHMNPNNGYPGFYDPTYGKGGVYR